MRVQNSVLASLRERASDVVAISGQEAAQDILNQCEETGRNHANIIEEFEVGRSDSVWADGRFLRVCQSLSILSDSESSRPI